MSELRKSCMIPDKYLIDEICNGYSGNDKNFAEEVVKKAFDVKNREFLKTHKPVYEIEDFKVYHRHLIMLRPEIAMLIHLFQRDSDDTWESIWLDDNEKYSEEDYECIRESAKQLMLQLEGHYCDAFIEALREECEKILEDSNKRKAKITDDINRTQS